MRNNLKPDPRISIPDSSKGDLGNRLEVIERFISHLASKDLPLIVRVLRDGMVLVISGAIGYGVGRIFHRWNFGAQLISTSIGVAIGANLIIFWLEKIRFREILLKTLKKDEEISEYNMRKGGTMNLSVIGTTQSGKSTVLTLLHLKALQSQIARKIRYKATAKRPGQDLYQMGHQLRLGQPLSPSAPDARTMPAVMEITYPGIRKKKVNITTIDVSGELVKRLLEVLPDAGYDLSRLEEQIRTWGLSPEDVEAIYDYILNCDAFLLVVDGVEASSGKAGVSGVLQDPGVASFLQNVRIYKETNLKSPRLVGIGVLITKTDMLKLLRPLLPVDPTPDQIRGFLSAYMLQTYGVLDELSEELKLKRAFFYHWLQPVTSDQEGKPLTFRVDPNTNVVRFPEDQYQALIDWCKQLS